MARDLVVVGAGIVGLAIAREWTKRRPDDTVAVLERELAPAHHQSGHNSGVIHGGIYYPPGSLKSRLCVEGARLMYEYCDDNAIPYRRCGKLIIAVDPDEVSRLDQLEARGVANGVPGLRRITADEIGEIEPNAVGLQALHAPNTGIVDYRRVAQSIVEELRRRGVDLRFGLTVDAIDDGSGPGGAATVRTDAGPLFARTVIVCAGLWADRLARRAGGRRDPQIVPFRGAYLVLEPAAATGLNGLIYPVPNPELPFLGVHITKHINGEVTLGPTAMLVAARDAYSIRRFSARDAWESISWPGTWRMAGKYWRVGIEELRMAASRAAFVAAAARYMPGLSVADLAGTTHAGVRAQALGRDGALVEDFLIEGNGRVIQLRNAPSPAATSSLALAREVVGRVLIA